MNISIFASIGAQNLGDELILKNEIPLLRKEFTAKLRPHFRLWNKIVGVNKVESINFKIASYDHKNPVFEIEDTHYFEYFPFGIKKLRNIFRNIRNLFVFFRVIIWSDIIVVGGGGIIYDNEAQSVSDPLDQWIFRVRVARFFRKKIYFYAIGIDIKKQENIKKLKKIFKNAYKISVRDQKSHNQLQDIGIQSLIVDDPVINELTTIYSHSSSLASGKEQKNSTVLGRYSSREFTVRDLEKYSFHGKKVGLALRSGYIGKTKNKAVENLLVAELCNTIESKGGTIVFLPHSMHQSDELANDTIFMEQFIRQGREIVMTLPEVYRYYREEKIDLIFSMRLHSMVLAYAYNIEQIALSYSQKTDEFLKKISQ